MSANLSTPTSSADQGGSVGRPRDRRAHAAILEATRELATEEGFKALTIEGVARRAGVAKTTIYRWWKGKTELVCEAFREQLEPAEVADTGSLRGDLEALVRLELEAQEDPLSHRVLPGLMAELAPTPGSEASAAEDVPLTCNRNACRVVERATARGELAEGTDGELLKELLAGALFWRTFAGQAPTDEAFVERLTTFLERGLRG